MSEDRSYRMLVMLQRDGREKYWDFHCPRCKEFITQVNNSYIQSMVDTFDQSIKDFGHSKVCPGRYCRIRYYFVFSS